MANVVFSADSAHRLDPNLSAIGPMWTFGPGVKPRFTARISG